MTFAFAQPNRAQCFALGKTLAKQLEPVADWTQIASELGVSRERAYYIGVSALGRIAFRLRETHSMEVFDD